MIKIQITEASDHRPSNLENDNRVWNDVIITENHEAALKLLVFQLNADVVNSTKNWLRVITV